MANSNNRHSTPAEPRLFTLEQANAMLPLVRAIVKDVAELSREVVERRERLSLLMSGRENEPADMYRDELSQVEHELQKDTQRLREYVQELQELGVEPKNGPEGLVDFRCLIEGRVVYLCWKLGEPEITHWHELDSGFAGRQPLPSERGLQSTGVADLSGPLEN